MNGALEEIVMKTRTSRMGSVSAFSIVLAAHLFAATDQEALIAQTASTLASADYARAKCKNVKIDEDKLASLIKRTGKSIDELRKDEDYDDQVNAIKGMEKGKSAAMVCAVLPMAHGGYGCGVLSQ
jgi:predicted PilT family ATPase